MSGESFHCANCGATWESRAAAVEIWRRGRCLACGEPIEGTPDEGDTGSRDPADNGVD